MQDIVWFEKAKNTGGRQAGDVSIVKVKEGFNIRFRNGLSEEMTETGYLRLGVSMADSKNLLYFMAADQNTGWKVVKPYPSTRGCTTSLHIRGGRISEALERFVGEYNLEISDDNLFYINRRNLL